MKISEVISNLSSVIPSFFLNLSSSILAIIILLGDISSEKHDPIALAILQLTVAAIISCITAPIIVGPLPRGILIGENLRVLLYMGLVSTLIGFLLQNICQKYTTPTTASLMLSLESVFGTIFAVIFLGETFNVRTISGCIIIFIAIIIAQTKLSFFKRNIEVYYSNQ